MRSGGINWLAVIVAAIAIYAVGFVIFGLLVPPEAPENLSGALVRLMRDPMLRLRLAEAGYERVRREFALERGIDDLERRFRESG